jgi:hypothetical protein
MQYTTTARGWLQALVTEKFDNTNAERRKGRLRCHMIAATPKGEALRASLVSRPYSSVAFIGWSGWMPELPSQAMDSRPGQARVILPWLVSYDA